MKRALLAVLGFGLASLLGACARSRSQPAAAAPSQEAGVKEYPLHGVIDAVNTARSTLTVTHHAVPGLMPGMTMEFKVSAGDLQNARVGQRIRGTLVDDHDHWSLRDIWPDDAISKANISAAAQSLAQDTLIRGAQAYRSVGENIPDFALYDQNGRVVDMARFRGKQIMMNFFYTACPIATMCPANIARMQEVQAAARAAGVKNLELVSISFDPAHDTPGVLKDYAEARHIDASNYTLLTGPEAAIRDLLTQFGVIAEFQDGIIKHTLATLLIDENGKIIHREDGDFWTVKEFVSRMRKG